MENPYSGFDFQAKALGGFRTEPPGLLTASPPWAARVGGSEMGVWGESLGLGRGRAAHQPCPCPPQNCWCRRVGSCPARPWRCRCARRPTRSPAAPFILSVGRVIKPSLMICSCFLSCR